MFAATVIQYSLPAAVSGSASAITSRTTTLNTRCRSATVATQVIRPEACRAAKAPPSAARKDRKTAPEYGFAAPPVPPLVSVAATTNSISTYTTTSTTRSTHGPNRHVQTGRGSIPPARAPSSTSTPASSVTTAPKATDPSATVIAPRPPPSTVMKRPLTTAIPMMPQASPRRSRPRAGTGARVSTSAAMPNSSSCNRKPVTPKGATKYCNVALSGYGPLLSTNVAHGSSVPISVRRPPATRSAVACGPRAAMRRAIRPGGGPAGRGAGGAPAGLVVVVMPAPSPTRRRSPAAGTPAPR